MKHSLISTLSVQVSDFHSKRLDIIDNEDYSGVIRKTCEDLSERGIYADDSRLDEGILALKQYYAVALLDPLNEHAVSDVVDPFWHAHILHTRRYAAFCDEVYGQFVHHEPLDRDDKVQVAHVAKLYKHTMKVLENFFDDVSQEFYPRELPTSRLICCHYRILTREVMQNALIPQEEFAAVA